MLDQSVHPFLEKYTGEDGTLIYRDEHPGRDGADDFYESFYNWPLLYVLGGGDHLLPLAVRQWQAITRQLTAYGHLVKEYGRGYDWFRQGESNLYFYFLCLADPNRAEHRARARRFARFYLNEDREAPNFDPVHRIIRAPHNGSGGPCWGFTDGEPIYGWSASMARYSLPFEDVPGITSYGDLKDPALARRMGEVMHMRMGKGDVVSNLLATGLITNAYLCTGEERHRQWVVEYVDAWIDGAQKNGDLLPDNVGLSGQVGDYLGGKWYGGLYGWTWPHGFYNVGMAAIVGAANAFLLTRDPRYLDLPRTLIDRVLELGEVRNVRNLEMSLDQHWIGQFAALGEQYETFVVPYRYGDSGWFDYQPMSPIYPVALWNLSMETADWERIERIRKASRYDWNRVLAFRTKEDSGHEQPWQRFLAGENPSYPEEILRESYGQVCWRLDQIRADRADLRQVNIHHWQQLNPVLTEALVQLTLGGPQVIYNGGLLFTRVRYFDFERRRPGLPLDVAALVSRLEANRTTLQLVNLSPFHARNLIVQAGSFGEHRFATVRYLSRSDGSSYPGHVGSYAQPELAPEEREVVYRTGTSTCICRQEARSRSISGPSGSPIRLRSPLPASDRYA